MSAAHVCRFSCEKAMLTNGSLGFLSTHRDLLISYLAQFSIYRCEVAKLSLKTEAASI